MKEFCVIFKEKERKRAVTEVKITVNFMIVNTFSVFLIVYQIKWR